ncbi:MAG TPA: hemolysin family protein [Gemmatirosa sp.]
MSVALWACGALALAAAFACGRALAVLRHVHGDTPPGTRVEADARLYRALGVARLAAHTATGATVARGGSDAELGAGAFALLMVAGALASAYAELAGREAGDAAAHARAASESGARVVARLGRVVVGPWVLLTDLVDRAFARALPAADIDDAARDEAAEQFREIVTAEAHVGTGERALLAGAFALTDTPVSDVMVPRVDVVGVPRDAPWAEVVARVRSAQHSRLPVYDGTIDDVVGVIYAKDLLPAIIADEPREHWDELVRETSFIPTTKRVDDQLRDFRASHNHFAVVVDEYGGTAGIVTIEDLLEEIVGEIRDERDDETPPIESEGRDRFWVSARLTLAELSEAIGYPVEHDEVSTVGGLIYELLGRVPRNGERLTIGPFRVVVERVVRRRIQRVYFERQPDAIVAAVGATGAVPATGTAEGAAA